jgi:hypothetical protein
MIHPSRILLMAAFSLLSALSAHAANTQLATTQAAKSTSTPISYLPFNITAPGTYVLTRDLISSATRGDAYNAAINISTAISGAVVVDLKGFTVTGPGSNSFGVTIGPNQSAVANTYPITIRNGTINNVEIGVIVLGINGSKITINNIVFNIMSTGNAVGYGVNFFNVSNSIVSNCTINGATYGLADYTSLGGNLYSNITFGNNVFPLIVDNGLPLTLNHCQFAAPAAN